MVETLTALGLLLAFDTVAIIMLLIATYLIELYYNLFADSEIPVLVAYIVLCLLVVIVSLWSLYELAYIINPYLEL